MKAGIAVKPGTPVDVLYPVLDATDPDAKPDVQSPNYFDYLKHTGANNWVLDGTGNDRGARFWRAEVHALLHAQGHCAEGEIPHDGH